MMYGTQSYIRTVLSHIVSTMIQGSSLSHQLSVRFLLSPNLIGCFIQQKSTVIVRIPSG